MPALWWSEVLFLRPVGLSFEAGMAPVHVGVLSFPAVAPTEDISAGPILFCSFRQGA